MNLLLAFLVAIFIVVVYYAIKKISEGSGQSGSTVPSTVSSLTSNLPSPKTFFWILFVVTIIAVTIFWVADQTPKSMNYVELRTSEHYENETNKDYGYSRINDGKFVIRDGELRVFKTIKITNTGIVWKYPDFGFSIRGIEGEKGERITVNVLLESRTGNCPFNFTIGPSAGIVNVEFGVNENDYIWVKVDNSPIPMGEKQFNSSGSYDLTVDITSNRPEETEETRNSCSLFIPSFYLTEGTFG